MARETVLAYSYNSSMENLFDIDSLSEDSNIGEDYTPEISLIHPEEITEQLLILKNKDFQLLSSKQFHPLAMLGGIQGLWHLLSSHLQDAP